MSILESIKRIFWPSERVEEDQAVQSRFQPQRYWESRHKRFSKSLQSVGHLQLSHSDNAKQYELKRGYIAELMNNYFPSPKGLKLLNGGCGIGFFTRSFVDMGFEVTAVDLSDAAIKKARLVAPKAHFVVSPLSTLQLNEGFDVVTAIDVLLHIVDDQMWRAALTSLVSHLHSNGKLLILDQMIAASADHPPHVKTRSLAEYKAMFVNLGLHIVEHEKIKLEQEDSWKDLLMVEFSCGDLNKDATSP